MIQPRKLPAKWTVTLEPGTIEYGVGIEQELARTLQEEIDWEIMCRLMQEVGWTKIETSWEMKSLEETYELKSWCEANLKGHRKGRGKVWLFELEKDASMFALRWA